MQRERWVLSLIKGLHDLGLRISDAGLKKRGTPVISHGLIFFFWEFFWELRRTGREPSVIKNSGKHGKGKCVKSEAHWNSNTSYFIWAVGVRDRCVLITGWNFCRCVRAGGRAVNSKPWLSHISFSLQSWSGRG